MNIKIETEHLSLRLLTENDLDNLEKLNADPDVRAFFPDGTQNREQTRKRMLELINNHIEHNLPEFIISEKESHTLLGRCGFSLIAGLLFFCIECCTKNHLLCFLGSLIMQRVD